MKSFKVDIDVTMSVQIYVEANSQEEAEEMAKKKVKAEPHYYLRNSFFVDAIATDTFNEDTE